MCYVAVLIFQITLIVNRFSVWGGGDTLLRQDACSGITLGPYCLAKFWPARRLVWIWGTPVILEINRASTTYLHQECLLYSMHLDFNLSSKDRPAVCPS